MNRTCFALAAALTALTAMAVEIGEKADRLKPIPFLDGKVRTLTAPEADRKFAVVYLWQPDQAGLSDFPRIAAAAEKFRAAASFTGVGIGDAARLKRFPGALRLGFPMAADPDGAVAEAFSVAGRQLPCALVLDRDRTLLWRGPAAALPGTLDRCISGKFDLKEEVRQHAFARQVNAAVKARDFAGAVKLLRAEWETHPDSLELLEAQLALLVRRLKQPEAAFALVHEAQRRNPGKHRFFEAEYKLLAAPKQEAKLPEFLSRVRREFADRPAVLMAFAVAEMGRPADALNMPEILRLTEAGWRSKGFKNDVERGLFAIEYAKIVHAVGRTDLAERLAKTAHACFKNDPKRREGARIATLYYGKMRAIAPQIQVPDLQK